MYYYYYYKSKDFSDASQKVAGALYKVTVCAVQVSMYVCMYVRPRSMTDFVS